MELREFFLARGFPEDTLKEPPEVLLNLGLSPQRVRAAFVVVSEGRPLMVADYAPGAVRSRLRALLAYARLAFPRTPPPLVLQTNGREFVLAEVTSGKEIAFGGPEVLPSFEELKARPSPPPVERRRIPVEERVLFIHSTGG
ncbi:hypothetical protein FVE67_01545 [Thermosulfurimonas marina]|uniref:Type I restriction enzyme R protein N-terminal domain-containing protein n=1 Tax=Thermosulfurimonas marina TaxID=2047767 RepID=A0A6H1WQR5_9BACT|nr:hypothetical protein [Thermosulfurimonas marina]QJA05557.1 hypothetical protein FVE67_01545 [Thermosulfurimonas marina]